MHNETNATFDNAKKVCQKALEIEIKDMSYDDCKKMVRANLSRFHKKLEENERAPEKDQMRLLLSKSLSPLYLTAATTALRQFGIVTKAKLV